MQPIEEDIWILLTRVLSGEAGSNERKKLNQWLQEDSANRAFFKDLQARWQEDPDPNGAYQRFLFDRESGASKLRHKIRKGRSDYGPPADSRTQLIPRRASSWKLVASILLVVGMVAVWGGHRWSPPTTRYVTSAMEQRIITLPDGSTARLNRNSKITFRADFSGAARMVTLQGEAFFQVKHDESSPFIVQTGEALIRDVGTSFNVKQNGDGKVVVAVKEGRATLRARNSSRKNALMLTKDHVGILDQGQMTAFKQSHIQNYMGWIKNRLIFEHMRLEEVVRQLDNIYGIHSTLADSSLAGLRLTAYTTGTSLDEVLDMIALSLEIGYQKKGSNVMWEAEGTKKSRINSDNVSDTIITTGQYL